MEKISPGISIAKIDLSNKSKEQAVQILSQNLKTQETIFLFSTDKKYEINLKNIDLSYDLDKSVQKAYSLTRTGNFFLDLGKKLNLIFKNQNLGLEIRLNEESLNVTFKKIKNELETEPVKPEVSLFNGVVSIEKGKRGTVLDTFLLRANIGKTLSFQSEEQIEIPFNQAGDVLDDLQIETLKARAENLIEKNIILKFNDQTFTFKDEELVSFLNPKNEYLEEEILLKIQEIASFVDREPQNSVFVFENGQVKEFTPSLDGYKIEKDSLKNILIGNLRTLEHQDDKTVSLDIPVTTTQPKIQNKDVNDLGIETLIGKGSSKFVGSIANRIYNINLSSSKFKGILVSPGDTFSFNSYLGDVSQETGFKQAYIIKEGKTILGDGGGVCQVSTTLFRAVLNAGLPILERQAHAYRVGYYEQDSSPGLDATVYSPHPDLIFKNDTAKHILIQSVFNEKNRTLVFEIYGTNDGRKATVTKPIISSTTPPGEDIYQEDPTLPIGSLKQIEYKAWGAKVKFDYIVERNGEIIFKKTFYSNYQPWQAVYLRGTKQE